MKKCRICNGTEYTNILSNIRTSLGENFFLYQCTRCSFVTIDPLPVSAQLQKYYNQTYWHNESVGNKHFQKLFFLFFKLLMAPIVRKIRALAPKRGRVLDWGAGDGAFVKLLEEKQFESWGIDINNDNSLNNRIIDTSIEDSGFKDKSFDTITCLHVLEHINDPVKSLKKAINLLKENGILVIEVPNISSLGFKLFGRNWQPLEIPTHLNHFNENSLQYLFNKMKNVEIIHTDFFSNRISSSTFILSLFPSLKPRRIRKYHQGGYPLIYLIAYAFLQLFAYPFVLLAAFLKRGEIIRIYARKTAE